MSLLFDLADIAEDLLFYGMKPPEAPPRAFHEAQRQAMTRIAPGSDDGFTADPGEATARLDRRGAETCDVMWQSIRLVLMSRRLSRLDCETTRRLGGALEGRAQQLFDGYCSLTPRWMLCRWLLGDLPAPPHWEATILHASAFIDAGARIGGECGAGLRAAGAAMIDDVLARE